MIHPDPASRPSASSLTKHPVLLTASRMSADQLRVELNAEKFKNALLQKYVPSSYVMAQGFHSFFTYHIVSMNVRENTTTVFVL